MNSGYEPDDAAVRWGCATALFIGAPIALGLMVFDALGDCDGPDCGGGNLWTNAILPAAIVAALAFCAVWALKRCRS